jgi:hypothetical protein
MLLQINAPIWRRLHVRSDSGIATLHELLQIASDWSDFHLHPFVIRGSFFRRYIYRPFNCSTGPLVMPIRVAALDRTLRRKLVTQRELGLASVGSFATRCCTAFSRRGASWVKLGIDTQSG